MSKIATYFSCPKDYWKSKVSFEIVNFILQQYLDSMHLLLIVIYLQIKLADILIYIDDNKFRWMIEVFEM